MRGDNVVRVVILRTSIGFASFALMLCNQVQWEALLKIDLRAGLAAVASMLTRLWMSGVIAAPQLHDWCDVSRSRAIASRIWKVGTSFLYLSECDSGRVNLQGKNLRLLLAHVGPAFATEDSLAFTAPSADVNRQRIDSSYGTAVLDVLLSNAARRRNRGSAIQLNFQGSKFLRHYLASANVWYLIACECWRIAVEP